MKKVIFLLLLPLSVLALESNSCVKCHSTIPSKTYVGHSYTDWERSPHAKADITCDLCHNGNPEEKDKANSHKGIINSNVPRSPLYFVNIPVTCGKCHKNELKEFKNSKHFKELKRSGKGPNCITCHGSMGADILSPRELDSRCNLCHNKPTKAKTALIYLNRAKVMLKKVDKFITRAKTRKLIIEKQEKKYWELKSLYEKLQERWHRFDVGNIFKSARRIEKKAKNIEADIKAKIGNR